jgi:hypothetical protein
MNDQISPLRALAEKYGKLGADAKETESLLRPLHAEAETLLLHLRDLPAAALALPATGSENWPKATADKLRSLSSIRTKLELVPGVVAKLKYQQNAVAAQIRVAVKSLARHYAGLADAKAEKEEEDLAQALLKHYAGDLVMAKTAAARALRGGGPVDLVGVNAPACDARKWAQSFAHYSHGSEPLEDAETIIGMAESFDRGEPAE